jgi:hypothetical protein
MFDVDYFILSFVQDFRFQIYSDVTSAYKPTNKSSDGRTMWENTSSLPS